MSNLCKTCKHWNPRVPVCPGADDMGHCSCPMLHQDGDAPTPANFGCVNWEAKPLGEPMPGPWSVDCREDGVVAVMHQPPPVATGEASLSFEPVPVAVIDQGMKHQRQVATAHRVAAAPLLLAACQYEAHTGMEDDLLYYIAEHLLSESRAIQEGFEKGGGNEDSLRVAAVYRRWSDQLFAKQKLQAEAIEAALDVKENPCLNG